MFALPIAVGSVWGLFADDPFFPFVGDFIQDRYAEMSQLLAVVGIIAFAIWMVRVVLVIRGTAVAPRGDESLPPDVIVIEGEIMAGADKTLTLNMSRDGLPVGADPISGIQAAFFSASQGSRVIVQDREAQVVGDTVRIPLDAEDTYRLRDGYLMIETRLITLEGNRTAFPLVAVATRGQLVRTRPPKRRKTVQTDDG